MAPKIGAPLLVNETSNLGFAAFDSMFSQKAANFRTN